MQSRAAVFHRTGQGLELTALSVPALSPGEVLVEIACCTICGSDLHTFNGRRAAKGPTVLGHEMIGNVIALGDANAVLNDINGEPVQIGDRVTWSIIVNCGACELCQRGLPQKCVSLFKYGHEPITAAPLSGGLAEHCILRKNTRILKIPASLSDEITCPANCATATVMAAFRAAGDVAGKTVIIHGAGMLGLTASALARFSNAKTVLLTDLSAERLSCGEAFGATHTFNIKDVPHSLLEEVQDITNGLGADVVLEMSGSIQAMESSIDLLGIAGTLVLVGAVFPTPGVSISPETVVRKLLKIEGVHNYAPRDLSQAVSFLEASQTQFPWASLVGKRFPLDDVEQALAQAANSGTVRVAVFNPTD